MEIRIPYKQDKQLGQAYNEAMETVKDWVLFLDHDVLILCPDYYDACLAAIDKVGHKAGWITGVTNRIGCPHQKMKDAPKNDDIIKHIEYARKLWDEHNNDIILFDMKTNLSGFFMLTHKKAWEDVGGFADGFLGVDNRYCNALVEAGYDIYLMPGIYCYHLYTLKKYFNSY